MLSTPSVREYHSTFLLSVTAVSSRKNIDLAKQDVIGR